MTGTPYANACCGACSTKRPPEPRKSCRSASTASTPSSPAPASHPKAARSSTCTGPPAPPSYCPGSSTADPPGRLFCSGRRAPHSGRRAPTAADIAPTTGRGHLSYPRTEYLFKTATATIDPHGLGWTLHQLRHSALTHLAADGRSATELQWSSGRQSKRCGSTRQERSPSTGAWRSAAAKPLTADCATKGVTRRDSRLLTDKPTPVCVPCAAGGHRRTRTGRAQSLD